jgi:hypothetical protein
MKKQPMTPVAKFVMAQGRAKGNIAPAKPKPEPKKK